MKATIELPDLPDGWEVVGHVVPKSGEMYFHDVGTPGWKMCEHNDWKAAYYITARRKQTLADWANEQPDLQVLARLIQNGFDSEFAKGEWDAWAGAEKSWPVPPCCGSITTQDGKWVNA